LSTISLHNITKQFKNTLAVNDVSLEIDSGEFFSIVGPSGCGKTTLLRIIAGFEKPTQGKVFMNGADITAMEPQERGIGMVFQNYALFPHMNVYENVAFGLETKKVARDDVRKRVRTILDAVNLLHKIETPVPSLSGGEQQRVAVARALVVEPAILLMDEPLSNLDVALRVQTREEIRTLQRKVGITTIYVTHDQSEAMSLSDRIAVMQRGKTVQVGPPTEIYEAPNSSFVAEFLGGANAFNGVASVAELRIAIGQFSIAVPYTTLAGWNDGAIHLIIKPEAILLSSPVEKGEYEGRIIHKEYLGFITSFVVECHGITLRATEVSSAMSKQMRPGDVVGVSFDWSKCILLPHSS
jgi:ABC-type Fe3+/spermidine/putrescine transport system ATPase subunit